MIFTMKNWANKFISVFLFFLKNDIVELNEYESSATPEH